MKNWTESKEERRARKAQGFSTVVEQSAIVETPSNTTRFVTCLKYGTKYGPEYVNNLYNMVKRNLTLDYEFVCFTENPEGLDPAIRVEPLPVSLEIQGWWYKPFFFNPKLVINGTILFLDLDIIVFRNIDHLFTYKPGEFLIIRDFNRFQIKNYNKFNSSVFRLETGNHSNVYTNFIKEAKNIIRKYHGDQDWIRASISSGFEFWPDEWIQSYKWEMRGRPKMNAASRGMKDFLVPGDPKILNETSIAVFHGDPNPHMCKDPWVVDNWR